MVRLCDNRSALLSPFYQVLWAKFYWARVKIATLYKHRKAIIMGSCAKEFSNSSLAHYSHFLEVQQFFNSYL